MPAKIIWTEPMQNQLRELRTAGAPLDEIAHVMCMSREVVREQIGLLKLPKGQKPATSRRYVSKNKGG